MKVKIIKTPKLQNGGGIYDNYQPSFTDDLAIGKSIGDFVGGINQAFNYVPGNFINKEINKAGNWIGRQFTKTPHASSNTVSPINTTPTLNNIPTTLDSNSLEAGNDLFLQGLQNGGLLPNVINKPLMKDGGHTFLTSQPAYTKKSYTYFGTSNAPARDSYTDNNEVNTTVKPVPEEISNIEAETGEFIYSDQGLYKILGDKHKDGGTPLIAKGGEFIFSDHKDMSLDPELQKQANLRTLDSKKADDHTPAKVLERNVDTKEYNRLKTILQNPKSDNITKKTAQFMLDKMDAKIKTIAQLQEAKKNPQPTEVENSYLEQPEIQQAVDQQKQFQDGGFYQNGVSGVTVADVNQIYDNQVPFNQGNINGTNIGNKIEHPQGIDQYGVHKQFTDQEVNDFIGRHQWFFSPKGIKNRSQLNPQIIGEFQKTYNPLYNNETGQNYFNIPGKPTTNVDNALGKWTINAPLFNYTNVVTDQTGNPQISNMTDRPATMTTIFKGSTPYISGQPNITSNDTSANSIKNTPDSSKVYTKDQSDLDIPNPYDKVKALQTGELMTDLMSNKPYFTYAAPEIQPWTVATKQSDQPLINQADKSLYIASQVASKLGSNTAMQQTLAKHAESINDALAKIGNVNAQAETANYNNNLTRNASLANRWADKLKQTYDQNTNVLDKTNFANASYLNKYSEAQQRDTLNKYYGQTDLLTSELPYLGTYETKNPNGTYTKHYGAPINPITRKFDPRISIWASNGVNQMSASKVDALRERIEKSNLTEQEKTDALIKLETAKKLNG